jgi:periplasmic divalent cation tolerance protein
MTDKIVILSTCASEQEAHKVARVLVEERLAACVNVVPSVRSFYHWKGAVESGNEWLLLIKSSRELFDALAARLESIHSYEIPEVIALPILDGAGGYMNWLQANLADGAH